MNSPIERIDKPSRRDFVHEYMYRNKPVIIRGVVDRWPCFTKWTPEYLKSVAYDQPIGVHYNEHASFKDWYVYKAKRIDKTLKFGELIDMWTTDPESRNYYMTEYRLRLVSPKLLEDVDFSDYFDPAREPYEPMVFLGRDTCMPLHYHGKMEAFLCQLVGDKRITLYAPDQYSNLYPGAWYEPHPLFSRIEGREIHARQVDLARFPKFENARPIEIEVHPGEMLFIPVHWWHLTAVDGFQLNLSHFFRSKLRCWRFPTPGFPVLARETKDVVTGSLYKVRSLLRAGRPSKA